MKLLVIDSGVSVKWFIKEINSAEARKILDEFQYGNIEFLAPDLIYAEFGNIIWKEHIFQNLPLEKAIETRRFQTNSIYAHTRYFAF